MLFGARPARRRASRATASTTRIPASCPWACSSWKCPRQRRHWWHPIAVNCRNCCRICWWAWSAASSAFRSTSCKCRCIMTAGRTLWMRPTIMDATITCWDHQSARCDAAIWLPKTSCSTAVTCLGVWPIARIAWTPPRRVTVMWATGAAAPAPAQVPVPARSSCPATRRPKWGATALVMRQAVPPPRRHCHSIVWATRFRTSTAMRRLAIASDRGNTTV